MHPVNTLTLKRLQYPYTQTFACECMHTGVRVQTFACECMHTGVRVGGAAGVGDEGLGGGVGPLLVGTLRHERGIPMSSG